MGFSCLGFGDLFLGVARFSLLGDYFELCFAFGFD